MDGHKAALKAKKIEQRRAENAAQRKIEKSKRIRRRMKKKSQKLLYNKPKMNPEHVQKQIEHLQAKLDGQLRNTEKEVQERVLR